MMKRIFALTWIGDGLKFLFCSFFGQALLIVSMPFAKSCAAVIPSDDCTERSVDSRFTGRIAKSRSSDALNGLRAGE